MIVSVGPYALYGDARSKSAPKPAPTTATLRVGHWVKKMIDAHEDPLHKNPARASLPTAVRFDSLG